MRLAAYLIDMIFLGLATFIVKVPMFFASFNPDSFLSKPLLFKFNFVDILFYVIGAAYFILLTYYTGSTFGKKLLNLKVISSDSEKLTLINVIYRETIGKYLSSVVLCIGYILIGFDEQKRGLHDMLCDTRVIYFKKPKPTYVQQVAYPNPPVQTTQYQPLQQNPIQPPPFYQSNYQQPINPAQMPPVSPQVDIVPPQEPTNNTPE